MSLFYLTNLLHLNCKSVATKRPSLWENEGQSLFGV
nr:MAG TPA: hypothetical protein [Caudoviricetes sp.]